MKSLKARRNALPKIASSSAPKPFTKGGPKGTGGRKKGTLNKATLEVRAICSSIVDNPHYFNGLKARALAGKLPPAVECMIWYYAKGKPIEMVQVSGDGGSPLEIKAAVAGLTDAELKAELLELAAGLG